METDILNLLQHGLILIFLITDPKEMTMLELLELQARARAIRSQLALEPVAKIELDSEDEDEGNSNEAVSTSNDKGKPTTTVTAIGKHAERNTNDTPERRIVIAPPQPLKAIPAQSTKPVKLKRNYKTRTVSTDGTATSTVVSSKEPSPSKKIEPEANVADQCDDDDDDVIRMERSPETFFISDSDEEPPAKKSPTKNEEQLVEEKTDTSVEDIKELDVGEISEKESKANSPEVEEQVENQEPGAPSKVEQNDTATDDDTVHLSSDTEIELHHQEEEAGTIVETAAKIEKKSEILDDLSKKSPEPQSNIQSDDDVVEINNSSDDEIMNDSEKSAGETAKSSETWEQRWLSSSKTQSILKTTQLASKVRTNMLKTRNTQKATLKKKQENEKAMKEKILKAEEGSMEQFKFIKEKSN